MHPIRILLADGHQNVRMQVRARLARESGFEVVGEAATSERVLELVAEARPDVLLIDPIMPDGHGLLAVSQLAPQMAVIVLTAFSDTVMQMELRRMGVRQILDKGIESERLVDAIRGVIKPSSEGENAE
ncbi:MAG: response regulator transcription factor [Chloroflexi bacterium]|nr:response regulator transcription factor [Chloroflexota bacterium]